MDVPVGDIDACAGAHRRLREMVSATDLRVGAPSLLPGWTVGHVLTHLARNAEAMCLRIDAATRGELVDQYANGAAGREAAIADGAGRPTDDIIADLLLWTDRLDGVFRRLPGEIWSRPVRTVAGGEHPVSLLPFRRWREVEVHLVDLDLGYSPHDWSPDFVERVLPRLIERLPDRVDRHDLTAWLFGRGPAPNLRPWG